MKRLFSMKKSILPLIVLLITSFFSKAQNTESIYHFMNETITLSPRENSDIRSDWGIFFSSKLYTIDERIYDKIDYEGFYKCNIPIDILDELKNKAKKLDTTWQNKFKWQKKDIKKFIVVNSDKNIPISALDKLTLTSNEKKQALKWIKEWNKTPLNERLINYASVPVLSDDGKYALVIRGQSTGSMGWDSVFIYSKVTGKWKIIGSRKITTL